MRFSEAYRRLRESLSSVCGDFSDYEARRILENLTGCDAQGFARRLTRPQPLEPDVIERMEEILSRRTAREPLEYILGEAWFCGLRLRVTPDCLIPQADTEAVCERARALLPRGGRLADVGTGSGCIALSVLAGTEGTSAAAYDNSAPALSVAEENAVSLGLQTRFFPVLADVFSENFMAGDGVFDVIVSNPPYIRTKDIAGLAPEVRAEPFAALDGGADGLRFYRRLLAVCPAHLASGGAMVLEIGYDEGPALRSLCDSMGLSCEIFRDFGGNDRGCVITAVPEKKR